MATPGPKRPRYDNSDGDRNDGEEAMDQDEGPNPLEAMPMPELMRQYYGRLFPFEAMYKWLAYCNDSKHPQADSTFFSRREFCFTLEGDIFVRYQSFKDGTELERAVCQRCPTKIDIGPVYSQCPKDRVKYAKEFHPVERELVFDVDLTDYDDVRRCGQGGHICGKCWPLMAVAVQIVDKALKEDFGFHHILWVYSGRRGVHCWVCDPSARQLPDPVRSSVVNYLSVYKGREKDKAKVVVGAHPHPAVTRAYEILLPVWEQRMLSAQRLLEDESMQEEVLRYVPDEEVVELTKKKWRSGPTGTKSKMVEGESDEGLSRQRWRMLVDEVELKVARMGDRKGATSRPLKQCLMEIVLAFTYPRLDVEVSKKMNHLLKAPFCIHPKTGKVCVPLEVDRVDQFDPDDVPTVQQLLQEVNNRDPAEAAKAQGWRGTRMQPCMEQFYNNFLDPLMATGRAELAAKSREVRDSGLDFSW